jgi:hypothetical protein
MQESHRVFRKGSYTCGPENYPYPSGKRPEKALNGLKEMRYAVALKTCDIVISLGVHLGFVWQNSLDVDAGHFDSRNIFIVFYIYASFCICLYYLVAYVNPYERKEWSEYLKPKETLGGLDCESSTRETKEVALVSRMRNGM